MPTKIQKKKKEYFDVRLWFVFSCEWTSIHTRQQIINLSKFTASQFFKVLLKISTVIVELKN